MRTIPVALTLLALSGCASVYTAHVPAAQRGAEPARRNELIEATKTVLRGRGFKLDPGKAGDGMVRTLPAVQAGRVPCGLLTCRYRDTFEVTVSPKGQIGVHLLREMDSPVVTPFALALENWTEPSVFQKETVSGIEAAQLEVLKEILQ